MAKARQAELEKALTAAQQKCRSEGCVFADDFTYLKNGAPVTSVRKLSKEEIDLSVRRVARIVKIGMFMDRYPAELSGGQQQRVAIARALASDAGVILADEPTGNLDEDTAAEITGILKECAHQMGKCVIIVTHSNELAQQSDVVMKLRKAQLQIADVSLSNAGKGRKSE